MASKPPFFFFPLSHLQSVQRLNYAKSFSVCFKASALIASSPPANTPCQVRPSSETLANQSKAQTPPSNGCWKLHRGHPDGFRIQSVFPHLPFFSAENLSFSLSKPLRRHIYSPSRRSVLVFSINGRIRARWTLRRPPCTFLTIFVLHLERSYDPVLCIVASEWECSSNGGVLDRD